MPADTCIVAHASCHRIDAPTTDQTITVPPPRNVGKSMLVLHDRMPSQRADAASRLLIDQDITGSKITMG